MLTEIRLCLGLLTRLPVGIAGLPAPAEMARAARWFPLVGALVGAIAALALWLCLALGVPGNAAVLIALGAAAVMTGGLHEDGLADCADGFGGADRPRRLAIMRDSRIGTYGVLALILAIGLKWALLAALLDGGFRNAAVALIVAGAVSRLAPLALMRLLDHARKDGMAVNAGRPDAATLRFGAVLALITLLPLPGPMPMLTVACAVIAGIVATGALASRRIGGQTGDVLGAAQQVTELLALLCIAAAGGR
jgi:adenosylcobinamide-GDP ribazoletransferase